jgi:hypothetical protein
MFPLGEIALLGACMMALTVLMRAGGTLPLRARLARGAPVAGGLFLAGLGLGRIMAVPGFVAGQSWPEVGMVGIGLLAWTFGLMRLFRQA